MDREEGALLPAIQLQGSSIERVWRQLFLWRGRPDVLNFNSEIVLAIALWTVLPRLRRPGLRAGFVAAYLVVFAYYLYEGASVTFFNLEPVFYSQFRMATEGFSFFLQNARVTVAFVAGTVLLIAAGAVAVHHLARLVLPDTGPSRLSRLAVALVAVLVLGQAAIYRQTTGRPGYGVQQPDCQTEPQPVRVPPRLRQREEVRRRASSTRI